MDTLVGLMREYYAYDRLKFDSRSAEKAMKRLLHDESLGRVWLIEESTHLVGYFVVTFAFSLEFHGEVAVLDELHINAAHRGRGIGKSVLAFVHEFCAMQGIKAIRLEVEHANIQAQGLYRKSGFKEHTRYLMTKWIDDSR
jgi:ribosomal protein S18 acetylase RimI-like enzyme